jgi:hypothetical protein
MRGPRRAAPHLRGPQLQRGRHVASLRCGGRCVVLELHELQRLIARRGRAMRVGHGCGCRRRAASQAVVSARCLHCCLPGWVSSSSVHPVSLLGRRRALSAQHSASALPARSCRLMPACRAIPQTCQGAACRLIQCIVELAIARAGAVLRTLAVWNRALAAWHTHILLGPRCTVIALCVCPARAPAAQPLLSNQRKLSSGTSRPVSIHDGGAVQRNAPDGRAPQQGHAHRRRTPGQRACVLRYSQMAPFASSTRAAGTRGRGVSGRRAARRRRPSTAWISTPRATSWCDLPRHTPRHPRERER